MKKADKQKVDAAFKAWQTLSELAASLEGFGSFTRHMADDAAYQAWKLFKQLEQDCGK